MPLVAASVRRLLGAALLACGLAACETMPAETPLPEGGCPSVDPPTYETFGRPFMEIYCTRCHASARQGASRLGAPSDHDFDTLAGIRGNLGHIHAWAGAGPGYVNTDMPPDGPMPTDAERQRLTEWLVCGAP